MSCDGRGRTATMVQDSRLDRPLPERQGSVRCVGSPEVTSALAAAHAPGRSLHGRRPEVAGGGR